MDADIAQLLKSLNIEGILDEDPVKENPPVSIPIAFHHQSVAPVKKGRRLTKFFVGGIFFLVGGIGLLFFFTKGIWWSLPVHIVHVYESANLVRMTPPFAPAIERINLLLTNDLSELPPSSGGHSEIMVQIASTKEIIEQGVRKLRDERDICVLADTLKAALQLFAGLQKDPLMTFSIDLDIKEKEAVETCLHSVEEALKKFPSNTYPRCCSLSERKAVSFLQGQFPSIDPLLFARVDGFLILKKEPFHLCALSENNLGSNSFSYSTMKTFMAPEGFLSYTS